VYFLCESISGFVGPSLGTGVIERTKSKKHAPFLKVKEVELDQIIWKTRPCPHNSGPYQWQRPKMVRNKVKKRKFPQPIRRASISSKSLCFSG
jgi:hypothetical protein